MFERLKAIFRKKAPAQKKAEGTRVHYQRAAVRPTAGRSMASSRRDDDDLTTNMAIYAALSDNDSGSESNTPSRSEHTFGQFSVDSSSDHSSGGHSSGYSSGHSSSYHSDSGSSYSSSDSGSSYSSSDSGSSSWD
jgi:hypothetical protein